MTRHLAVAILGLLGLGAQARAACLVPHIRTLDNQTVDGFMTVSTGKQCGIFLRLSRGPIYSASIVAHPRHGSVLIGGGNRVIYQSRSGYIGSDTFTYSRRGFDARNNQIVRTVRISVTVTP